MLTFVVVALWRLLSGCRGRGALLACDGSAVVGGGGIVGCCWVLCVIGRCCFVGVCRCGAPLCCRWFGFVVVVGCCLVLLSVGAVVVALVNVACALFFLSSFPFLFFVSLWLVPLLLLVVCWLLPDAVSVWCCGSRFWPRCCHCRLMLVIALVAGVVLWLFVGVGVVGVDLAVVVVVGGGVIVVCCALFVVYCLLFDV